MSGSNGSITSFGFQNIETSKSDIVSHPQIYTNGSKRGVIHRHADGDTASEITLLPSTQIIMQKYPMVGSDQGIIGGAGVNYDKTWGNDTCLTNVNNCITYLQTTLGWAKSGKVFLTGYSMGGLEALVYAAHNNSKVAAIWVTNPALNLEDMFTNDRGSVKAHIKQAYGLTTGQDPATQADPTYSGTIQANRDPYYMAGTGGNVSLFTSYPIIIWEGAQDNIVGSGSPVPDWIGTFASTVNAAGGNVTVVVDPSGGHFIPTTQTDLTNQGYVSKILDMFDAYN